jgi:hypothetical protein
MRPAGIMRFSLDAGIIFIEKSRSFPVSFKKAEAFLVSQGRTCFCFL